MKKIVSLFAAVAFMATTQVHARDLSSGLTFASKLNGAQEVPAVTTNAIGVASLFLNSHRDSAFVNITVSKLSGPITGIRIHQGKKGTNGSVLVGLENFVVGNRIVGKLDNSVVTESFIRKLLKDSLYVNVHTAQYPNGEIRGQLHLESDIPYSAWLNGAQESPAVNTPAYGLGSFVLCKDSSKLKINVVVQGLTSAITAAHLHVGAPGVSGPAVVDLSEAVNDSVISTEIDPSNILGQLDSGNIYINVHTASNPNGEVRGQLVHHKALAFDAWLDGLQETPPVVTDAKGVACVKFSPSLDTLYYKVVASNLSGPITGAHFHRAGIDTAGPAVIDIADSIVENTIIGHITGTELTDSLINDFLEGRIYVNLHTAQHPAGEIRGQVFKVAREGFTLTLQGTQVVPQTPSLASGSGVVSIDRSKTNATYVIVVNDLSGPITSAHFHVAPKGEVGAPVHDITSRFSRIDDDDAAWGSWTSTNGLDSAIAKSLTYDSVYVNIHTAAYPTSGEVRGQVVQGAESAEIVTDVKDLSINTGSYLLAPNPTQGLVQLSFTANKGTDAKVSVVDVYGKEVFKNNVNVNSGENTLTLNLDTLQSGVYQVTIYTDNGAVSQKLVKN
jgi:hypothetical protein